MGDHLGSIYFVVFLSLSRNIRQISQILLISSSFAKTQLSNTLSSHTNCVLFHTFCKTPYCTRTLCFKTKRNLMSYWYKFIAHLSLLLPVVRPSHFVQDCMFWGNWAVVRVLPGGTHRPSLHGLLDLPVCIYRNIFCKSPPECLVFVDLFYYMQSFLCYNWITALFVSSSGRYKSIYTLDVHKNHTNWLIILKIAKCHLMWNFRMFIYAKPQTSSCGKR